MEGRTEKFSDILKDYVLERKKVNPKISESQIAKNLGVSITSFHRILNYNAFPSVPNLLKLCKSVPKLKSLVTEEMLEVTKESKTGKYMGKELENLISEKHLFIAYALALSSHGVTEEGILYCLGHEGIKALSILIEKGFVIKKDNNRYKAIETDKGIILSFKVLKKHIKILAEKYKPDNVANNYIYYKMETLNKEGMRELYKIHKETHRKVQRLMEKEEYKGDTPAFSVGFFDMLFLEASNNKRRGVR
ncbi:MAG: hypothetical protein OXM55_03700 [Bdellovibrionales bacterium]|nr:hypothetical protein [Bdellovibrionales bacterium]